jgi:hypothetical protein
MSTLAHLLETTRYYNDQKYTTKDAMGIAQDAIAQAAVSLSVTFDGGGPFGYGLALEALRAGRRVARSGWNGKSMWLELQVPDKHSKMTLPYIYMKTADDQLVPWLCSQTDALAEDWSVVHE